MAGKPAFIRWSREREAEIQSRMLDVLEAQFRRQIRAAIIAESDRILAAYRELGYVPPASDDDVLRFRAVYQAMALAAVRAFGRRIVTQGKAAGHDMEHKAEGGFAALFQALANAWIALEPIRRRIQSVTETTREMIVAQVSKGQQDGLAVDEVSRNISKRLPQIARSRSAIIARTELHGAANYGMHETAKSTGFDLVKEWVAVQDARTRRFAFDDQFDHMAMDGQTRPMDEPFSMPWLGGGGEPLPIMYPGEAGKPGGAVINCRCASIHKIADLD